MKTTLRIGAAILTPILLLIPCLMCGSPDTFVDKLKRLNKTSDTKIIADFALNSDDPILRREAAKKLVDQHILAIIAKNDSNLSVRKAAIEKLTDKRLLVNIVSDISYQEIQKLATERLDDLRVAEIASETNQKILGDLSQRDPSSKVRIAATEKLTDQRVLAHLAQNDSIIKIRQIASRKLLDQRLLAKIARIDTSAYVREVASRNLTDIHVLAEIALYDTDPMIRRLTEEKLYKIEAWYLIDKLRIQKSHPELNQLRLILLEPDIYRKYGRSRVLVYDSISEGAVYRKHYIGGGPVVDTAPTTATLYIEHLSIKIVDGNGSNVFDRSFVGSSAFREEFYGLPQKTNPAQIEISEICFDLLRPFETGSLQKFAKSENEYLREAANSILRQRMMVKKRTR